MGSAEECALVGTLYMRVRLRVCWQRFLRRLKKRKKRACETRAVPRFVLAETALRQPPEITRACSELRAGYRGRVYRTGLLRTGILSYVSRN
jgi:hypothetical protein